MIDSFALALTHALLALTAWRLMRRADLDQDGAVTRERPKWGRRPDA